MADIRDLHTLGSFEDIAEWIENHADVLWKTGFPNKPMPEGFCLSGVEIDHQYSNDAIMFYDGRDVRMTRGFHGNIRFNLNVLMPPEQAARMFEGSGIIIEPTISYAVMTQEGVDKAVKAYLKTHLLRFKMLADEWVSLAVMEILSRET